MKVAFGPKRLIQVSVKAVTFISCYVSNKSADPTKSIFNNKRLMYQTVKNKTF